MTINYEGIYSKDDGDNDRGEIYIGDDNEEGLDNDGYNNWENMANIQYIITSQS